jgi:o-succinylbenzoate synthase
MKFIQPAGTSRGVMTDRRVWMLVIEDEQGKSGIGEIAPLPGLSPELDDLFERSLDYLAEMNNPTEVMNHAYRMSSLRFGWETAMLDLARGGERILFPGTFVNGESSIRINGLIWMGDKASMLEQVKQKLSLGFTCLKMKIGAISLDEELEVLQTIRGAFAKEDLELRLDANGAFVSDEAPEILDRLAEFHIHSIEQPIRAGQPDSMAELCASSPIPIALDEELIGIHAHADKEALIARIKPQFIILKPSLHGGITGCDEWIRIAESHSAGWWITSALESNIGLNAIAQYAASKDNSMPQGLGTGQLYETNIPCPLRLEGERLRYDVTGFWDLTPIGL